MPKRRSAAGVAVCAWAVNPQLNGLIHLAEFPDDARWSNVDELSQPALAHPSDALLQQLLHVRGRFWRPGEELGWQPCAYSMRAANAECGVAAAKANHRMWMLYNRTRRGGGRGRGR